MYYDQIESYLLLCFLIREYSRIPIPQANFSSTVPPHNHHTNSRHGECPAPSPSRRMKEQSVEWIFKFEYRYALRGASLFKHSAGVVSTSQGDLPFEENQKKEEEGKHRVLLAPPPVTGRKSKTSGSVA